MSSERNFPAVQPYGYTLIELILVVALVGILAVIGVTNYQSQVRRTKQQEAKVALSAIYAGEMHFFINYFSFIPSLDAIGYVAPPNRVFWHAACANDTWSGTVSNYTGPTTTQSYAPTANEITYLGNFAGSTCIHQVCSGIGNDPKEIYAIASGQLVWGGITDSWEIDKTKKLKNCSNGL